MAEEDRHGGGFDPALGLRDLAKDKLLGLLAIYARMYQKLDGLWFTSVKGGAGGEEAAACDRWVWEKQSKQEARRLSRQMNAGENDVAGVMKTLQISPWAFTHDFRIDLIDAGEAQVTFTRCPSLEAMERAGDGRERVICQGVSGFAKQQFASAICPGIKVTPLEVPPRQDRDGICCRWRFKTGRS